MLPALFWIVPYPENEFRIEKFVTTLCHVRPRAFAIGQHPFKDTIHAYQSRQVEHDDRVGGLHSHRPRAAEITVDDPFRLFDLASDDLSPFVLGRRNPSRVPKKLVKVHDRQTGDLAKTS